MPLPDNFNSWEHFQNTFRQVHNRRVKRSFSDVGGDDWDANITTPRASLRVACTIDDNDSADICLNKQLFYWLDLGFIADLVEPYYGIPVEEYQANVKFKPQVTLKFREDDDETDIDYRPLRMRVSFRLVNETSGGITWTDLRTLAGKMSTEFCSGNGYKFHKGKLLVTYKDIENGYDFQLYAYTKNDAKDLIKKVLSLNNDTPNWKYLRSHEDEEPTQNYPTIPGNLHILQETVKAPRKRPVGQVRFQYAECKIHGRTKPVILCDRTYRFLDALVQA